MHHRQQVNLEPVGGARALLVEDGIEIFPEGERVRRVALGVRPDIPRRQPPDMRLQRVLLADLEATGFNCLNQ
jgi:hypothetical protein